MSPLPPDAGKWPRLLGLSVHEFRTPMTVVAGYIRMLLKDRAGALTDQQRKLLEEAEKSCGRLSGILTEMSDLANLEAGTATFNRSTVDMQALLADAVAALPPVPDRDVVVTVTTESPSASVTADPVRLKTAIASVLIALRRELVSSNELFVRERSCTFNDRPATRIAMGDAGHIDALASADERALTTFDEWRGGCGLSLAVARRVIEGLGGAIWSPADGSKAGAVLVLPRMGA